MLTHAQLVEFHRALEDEQVLSVYVDGSADDPAQQRAWRLRLDHELDAVRAGLGNASHSEQERLERCLALLDDELARFSGGIGAAGWAAFITSGGVREAHPLPVVVPTLARWSRGPWIGPYTHVLREARPVIVGVADSRSVDLHRYVFGRMEHVETIDSSFAKDHSISHMGATRRPDSFSGKPGAAGHDVLQRETQAARDRMLSEASDRILELAGDDGWIVLGGIPAVAANLEGMLRSHAADRVIELDGIDMHDTSAQLADAARSGASSLRDATDARRLSRVENLAGAHGEGALGPDATRRALEQESVRELYLTPSYLEDHSTEAEQLVRSALDQDATIAEVCGEAARRLDDRGGAAALLRYRVSPPAGAEGAAPG